MVDSSPLNDSPLLLLSPAGSFEEVILHRVPFSNQACAAQLSEDGAVLVVCKAKP